jgi:hypothetical protein
LILFKLKPQHPSHVTIMKLHPLLTACAALLALCPTLATAQTSAVPNFISYQGRVVDAAGANVGAVTPVNRTVIFRIWDSPSSTATANLIYSEAQTVTVSEGEFSVLVGQGVTNPTETFGYSEATKKLADLGTAFTGSARYLSVTVAAAATIATTDNEITPRQQIVSTAFAMRAKFAESIGSSSDLALTPLSGTASNYGLGWYGTDRLFGTTAVDGPVLYGNAGGALGSNASGTRKLALSWDASGRVGIGATSISSATNKLTLQGDMTTTPADQLTIRGNADNNKRLLLGYDTTANKASLQSYTALSTTGPLLLNPAGGNVGVNNAAPSVALDVTGAIKASSSITGSSFSGNGASLIALNGANISDATVTGAKIASSTITSNKLAADVGVWSVAANGIYTGRRVSIGDPPSNTPDATWGKAPFEVNTWGIGNALGNSWRVYNTIVYTVENQQLSIYAALDVSARQYYVRSDARIKKIKGRSSGLDDLASLMGIEVTDYQFKDMAVNGSAKQKKVIAQQVETVFPQAVSKSCDVVPDIYIKAAVKDGWIELKTDLKKGERVRLIAQEADGIFEVLEVSKDRFRTQLKPEGGEVFVFGREVNDFRTVDYDAIAMLNVSATQQIKREKDSEIQTLRDENAALRRELAAKDASLETRLIALERRMSKEGGTETVSLKTAQALK